MDDFELEIKKEFIEEALLNLEETEESFMQLENADDNASLLDQIFRLAHNLKGGSRAVGFGDVAEFTHELENLVLKLKNRELGLTPAIVTLLLRSNDRLIEMLSGLREDLEASFDNSDVIAELVAMVNGGAGAAPEPVAESAPEAVEEVVAEAEPENAGFDAVAEMPDAGDFFEEAPTEEAPQEAEAPLQAEAEAAPEVAAAPPQEAAAVAPAVAEAPPEAKAPKANPSGSSSGGASKNTTKDEVVRVSLQKIDTLNDLVGELIVIQSMIQQQNQSAESQSGSNEGLLTHSIQQGNKLAKDIQSLSMSLRMFPVKPLVQKLKRTIRDTSQSLGKAVNFEVEGDSIDVDKSVLDNLADPLIHVLRNAVDHGLESLDERLNGPKGAQGLIRLSFKNEGNFLVVEVKDDGKGIDPGKIKEKALEKGVINPTQNLSDKQLINLIFHPGFSTKAETSEISGRGVGMDVVKTNIEKMGGQVDVTSVVGEGSLFRIKIPLSLAVIEGLVVRYGQQRFVIPLSQVQETLNLGNLAIQADKTGIGECFALRGTIVPLLSLGKLLGTSESVEKEDIGLLFSVQEHLMAIRISDVIRSQQIVIKPLGNGIEKRKGWIGSCVLGDGNPTLILNPQDLLEGRVNHVLSLSGSSNEIYEGKAA